MDFTQITADDERMMLDTIGVSKVADLFAPIPADQRLGRPLKLPAGCSELELMAELESLASRNAPAGASACFLGCGAYDHFIPSLVDHLAMRGEFLTAYTPYQAEASQGTLQAFYEFQTMICQLTGMDIANASLYEGASAAAEAVLLARAATKRSRVVVSGACHPEIIETLTTYATRQGITVSSVAPCEGMTTADDIAANLDDTVMAVVIQLPNFFGLIEETRAIIDAAHQAGALAIVSYDPIASGLLQRPGDLGADIVVGEGQALGIPLQYGAPYLGFLAARETHLRRMPGRVVGVAHDDDGARGFCLVLQTREQHIKRERATSNVCTNQGLMAMRAAVYLSSMGRRGIKHVANLCFDKAHYAADRVARIEGFELRFKSPFFKEFVVRTNRNVSDVLASCRKRGILAGVPMARWFGDMKDCFTVAVTEKRTKSEIDKLIEALTEPRP